ncbi:MAG TPA: MBL fold metallo-hydrolase [Kiritimatiellia bacterium]|nr:MBL fold metallo-hydrolase [Kiritimatiellia bacterium]
MKLHFYGGADTVTGSMHMIEANGSRIIRDAGLFQGRREEARRINENPGFDAGTLDAILLSHAHIDHCGNLPTICKLGFNGAIHATTATTRLTEIMLRDSAYIQSQDAAYLNQKTNRKGMQPIDPLYTIADAESAISRLRGHHYHEAVELAPGIRSEAYEAGHILGSELSYITVEEQGRIHKIGFAVDLGRHNLPLIRDPETMPPVDVLVMESTYGNRKHGDAKNAREQLREVIAKTWKKGGRVIIPAFALERAQELIYHISSLMLDGKLEKRSVYLDSPMAAEVTKVFDQHTDYLDDDYAEMKKEMGCLLCPPWVKATPSVEESKAVTGSDEVCVVVAASGMCEHGRILHHLKHSIENPDNTIVIVGYQAMHTLGRRLVEQQKEVKIFGDTFERKAGVVTLDAFSAHADRDDLVTYAKAVNPGRIFLVHGEKEAREALAGELTREIGAEVLLPKRGDVVEIGS